MSDIQTFRVAKRLPVRGYEWLIGVCCGIGLLPVNVIGTTVFFLSIILFFQSFRSESNTCARLFNKGLRLYKQKAYGEARALFRRAYEIDHSNVEIIRMLLILDLHLGDALAESKMLLRHFESMASKQGSQDFMQECTIFQDAFHFQMAQ